MGAALAVPFTEPDYQRYQMLEAQHHHTFRHSHAAGFQQSYSKSNTRADGG
jgi:hypothetical protein